jgi:NitT/TauT family transport system substrate-binding protein
MLTETGRTVVALLFGAVTAAVAATSAGAADKKITLVQMHPVIGVGEEVFLYAVPKRLGFFAAEGLDVDVQGAQNGVVAAQVLQSKGAQVGTTAPEAIMLVRERRRSGFFLWP